ncbi:MAG: hypothetical protein NTZ85_01980, partial [Bacteroidia bacterium]|nr:hypothetical protein [Bacteroidia bacterium]
GTNNKPVSDAQKEKIKGEVKEVMSTIIKGAEEANFDMIIGNCLDSPDFVFLYNGNLFNYQKFADMGKSIFATLINQKSTILDEKYMVIDNSNVLYTANSKWVMNFKDGHAILQYPWALQYLFKKVDNKWIVISANESGFEKSAKNSETSKEINQVELHRQFIGSWKSESAKDTTILWDVKSYGTGFEGYFKCITKGKIFIEGKQLWGYDKNLDKYSMSEMIKGMDNALYSSWFIATNKCVMLSYNDISNPDNASMKYEVEFKSPDILVQTTIVNNKPVKIDTMTRVK